MTHLKIIARYMILHVVYPFFDFDWTGVCFIPDVYLNDNLVEPISFGYIYLFIFLIFKMSGVYFSKVLPERRSWLGSSENVLDVNVEACEDVQLLL